MNTLSPIAPSPAAGLMPGGCIPPKGTNPSGCWDDRPTTTRPAAPTSTPDRNCWDPRTWTGGDVTIQLPHPDASIQATEAAALLG